MHSEQIVSISDTTKGWHVRNLRIICRLDIRNNLVYKNNMADGLTYMLNVYIQIFHALCCLNEHVISKCH